jgi:dihydroorotate dehydrogenase
MSLARAYRLTKPVLFRLGPEFAHACTSVAMRCLSPFVTDSRLRDRNPIVIFDRKLYGQIGIAAGFDKFCHAPQYLHKLGFGFVESGSLTPLAQSGNPKPRLARLPEQQALLNKMGFNNPGFIRGWKTLRRRIAHAPPSYQIALSLGKGKATAVESAADDYVQCLEMLRADPMSEYLFYVAINVSSPNTPNLRALQQRGPIKKLVSDCVRVSPRPVVVKFAPDFKDMKAYKVSVEAALEAGAAGIIISNTTTDHSLAHLPEKLSGFGGGLSGKPLAEKARSYLAETIKITKGKVPVISSGGIYAPEEANLRLEMGATMVQVYTGLIYYGPNFARDSGK